MTLSTQYAPQKNGPRTPNIIDIHVGTRLRIQRQSLGMSQEKLGDAIGVTFQQVQKYERGANRIGASRLWKLSQTLKVPVTFFFDGLDNAAPDIAPESTLPIVYDFINSTDGVNLAKAVSHIKNKNIRRQYLELGRALAQPETLETA